MKKLKVVILSALVMTGLAGCGDKGGNEPVTPVDPEPEHTHKFSSEWTSNETQHWHAATCEHTDLKANVANHVDSNHDGKCDECLREGLAVQHTEDPNKPGFCICGEKISVVAVELDTSKAKLVYAPGEELDTTGVKLTATYLDGATKEIDFTPSAVDLSTTGKKTVTLTYSKEDLAGTTGTISYDIDVVYWSAKEIEVIQDQTFLGLGELVLPYLPGMKLDYVEGEEGVESWFAFKENATLDDYTEYYNEFNTFNAVRDVDFGSETVELTFRFAATSIYSEDEEKYIEREYGFAAGDFFVFRLAPLYEDDDDLIRAFLSDEYFICGINGDGELRVYDRFVSAYTDSFLAEEDEAAFAAYDVALIVKAGYEVADFLGDFNNFIGFYFSEIASGYIPVANSSSTSGLLILESEQSSYPFMTAYDDYEMVPAVDIINATESDYEAFVTKLLDAGYEQDAVDENLYVLENQYVGRIEFELIPYSEHYVTEVYSAAAATKWGFDAGYGYTMYYAAPERGYVSKYTPIADQLIAGFGELASDVEFEADNETYYYQEAEFVYFTVKKDETDLVPTDVLAALYAKLPKGFYIDGVVEYDEEYECYYASFTNGSYGIELDVYEPNEAGDVEVTLIVYEGYDILETYVSKVALFAQINGFQIQLVPTGDGYTVATAVPTSEAAKKGIDTLEKGAEYIVGAYVEAGLVAVPTAAPTTTDGTDLIVTTKSVDGDYDVVFTFYVENIEALGGDCFVIEIYIEESTPWAGTAEEGFIELLGNLPITIAEEYCHVEAGVYYTDVIGFASVSAGTLAELKYYLSVFESCLPKGYQVVSTLVLNQETHTYDSTYVSADGSVTFVISIGMYNSGSGTIWGVNITVMPTPAPQVE